MPKPVRQLQESQRPLEQRVLEFLRKDTENAYTVNEIIAGVEGGGDRSTGSMVFLLLALKGDREKHEILDRYGQAVKKLVEDKQVRIFQEGSVTYYAAANQS